MFENYKSMSADEQARVKAIHKAIRKETPTRSGNLAWAFVRGFPYRRVERTTHTQIMPDGTVVNHNPPRLVAVARIIVTHIHELEAQWFAGKYQLTSACPLAAWAKDPSGAIPAPVPRAKKPFVRPVASVA
jgi:hypothetical protein